MMERLFDIITKRVADDPDGVLLAAKEAGSWRTYSAAEAWQTSCKLANGLLVLGIDNTVLEPKAQEKIAIISPNCPEWIMTDIAVQLTGAVLTPIYPTISPAELLFVLNEAGIRKLFIANAELYTRLAPTLAAVPTLEHIFSFQKTDGLKHWQEAMADHSIPDEQLLSRIESSTLATIIYTSGTTGNPKGVMLSHRNIVSNVRDSMPVFTFAEKGGKALSFLPLNHIFERMVTYIYIKGGLGIYYAESMETIGENLREVKPIVFTTVPRLLEKVYERIVAKGLELKGIKRALFFWALALGKKYDNAQSGGWWYNLQLSLANKLIFNKWRAALGGNIKAIVSGSAACQVRLLRIFTAAKVIIMEGYGLTETSPVISVNRFESDDRRIGTVGPLIANVQVQLATDGEILTKGPNVMMGYYKRPDLTVEALKNGWFHTGDIGEWQDGRFLKITDRKKEIFKTSGGKYVAPQVIENKMRESPYIEQMMVIGNGRKFVSALIVPSFLQLKKYLQDNGKTIPQNNEALLQMEEVRELFDKQLEKYNPQFNHVEQVKKYTLLPKEWTVDTGELTPSLKIRRKAIEVKFERMIEEIYG
jgi:long-chain acyl-CoA synthetase